MRIRTAWLAALTLGLLCFAVAASAAPQNIVFILDASNSMHKPFGVDSRLDVAKQALIDLLPVVEEIEQSGLYVYGHRIDKEDEQASCQDIEALFPILAGSAAGDPAVIDTIRALEARGKTPIADALITVSNDLTGFSGESVIILITDGEETCGGDPVVVAQMLRTLEPPIVLHVVGLDISEDVRLSLTEIAGVTGGSYYGVASAMELRSALLAAIAPEDDLPVIEPSGIPAEYACYGVTNVIYGTEGDDVLYGTEANDLILGYGGNDFLIGLEGNDVLIGGPGDDILEGGIGDDILDGGDGNDLLFGGVGDDIVCGGYGNDSLEGDAGNDILDGGEGMDTLLGGTGKDVLYCADAADVMMEGSIVAGTFPNCPACTSPCPLPAPAPCTAPAPCPAPAPPTPAPCPPVEAPAVTDCPLPPVLKTVNEGETLQLHGTVSDADCNVMQILWQVSAGSLNDPTCLDPVYTAPMLAGCENLEVQVTLTAVDSCGASATDAFSLLIVNVNHPPVIDAGPEICVDEGTAITVMAQAYDPNDDALTYQWSTTNGLGSFDDPTSLNPVFVAPMIDDCEGIDITLLLTVTDACGASVCDTTVVHVRNVNAGPSVDLGPDFAIAEGSVIRLTPQVFDPESDDLLFCWSTTGGLLDSTSCLSPIFTAPWTELCDGEPVTITLTVTDPCGLSATDSVVVYIENVNTAPTVELGTDLCVPEGGSLVLAPTTYDPEGDALVYRWTTTAGILSDACAGSPVFQAPVIDECEGMDVVVTVTVTDPCGLSATDSMVIRVENINQPPVVKADP